MVTAALAALIAVQAPTIRADYVRPDDWWAGDRGAGLIRPAERTSYRQADTLRVYSGRSTRGAPIAFVVFDERGHGTWQIFVVARDTLRPLFVEYGYEVAGIPIDEPPANGWAHVMLGRDRQGRQQLGWTPADTATVDVIVWRDWLSRDRGLFFVPPRLPAFFDGPGGAPVRVALRDSSSSGYFMTPDSVAGDWMRVRVMQPHGCGEERPRLVRVAWIRYLGERGRPQVYYHTRGC